MVKSIVFKEWLKIRWAAYAVSLIFLLMLGYIYLNTSYYMRFMAPSEMWYNVVVRAYIYYGNLFIYLPLFAGILIGITQFVPEISENKLKLHLHLPLKENYLLFWMIFIGTALLLIIFIVSFLILELISSLFFPYEVLKSVLLTSLPWFLTGLIGYWAVAMISIEILWKVRVAMMILSFGFISLLLNLEIFNSYENSILIFILLSLFFTFQIFLSGYRFRKGVI